MVHVGIDLDNTLIDYDRVFGPVGVELGLLPAEAAGLTKTEVRARLRAERGGEETWMRLQGQVYGRFLVRATPYAGAEACLRRARALGAEISIVSHKTRFGHHDPTRIGLWEASLIWLEAEGFFAADGLGLTPERVHFSETRAGKIARIAEIGCALFIDDLPEVLLHPDFPARTRRVWFANGAREAGAAALEVFDSWAEITEELEILLSLTGDQR